MTNVRRSPSEESDAGEALVLLHSSGELFRSNLERRTFHDIEILTNCPTRVANVALSRNGRSCVRSSHPQPLFFSPSASDFLTCWRTISMCHLRPYTSGRMDTGTEMRLARSSSWLNRSTKSLQLLPGTAETSSSSSRFNSE